MRWPCAECEIATERRAKPEKRAPAGPRVRALGGRGEQGYAAPEVGSHVSFPWRPCRRVIHCYFAALSVLANLVNAKGTTARYCDVSASPVRIDLDVKS